MTPERIAQVENAIAAQEAAGMGWTNLSIYRQVGGKYSDLAQYLKARRASVAAAPRPPGHGPITLDAGEVLEQMALEEPSTLQEELAAAIDAEQHAEARLSVLEELARTTMLSEAQEIEAVRLERRTRNLAAVISQLQQQIAQQQEVVDVERFCASWQPLCDNKRQLYEAFHAQVIALWQSLGAIEAQHNSQVDAIMSLPPKLQRYLLDSFLPDTGTMRARLAGSMVNPQGWTTILCQLGPPRVARVEDLMDNDPGTRALPPRLIQNALTKRPPAKSWWVQKLSADLTAD